MHKSGHKKITYLICALGALGGLLFGLDQGFIANSLDTIKTVYDLDTTSAEQYSALLATGGVISAFLSGLFARYLGRRNSLVFAGLLFTLASLISACLPSFNILLICRFFLGFAVGIASFISPLYLAEVSPPFIRGSMGTLFQLMITVGIFFISFTNVYILSIVSLPTHSLTYMFLVITLFAAIMLFGSLILPRSPRWLMLTGRRDEAAKVIRRMAETEEEVAIELKGMEQTLQGTRGKLIRLIMQRPFVKVLLIGVFLQMFQQLVGINMMIYYAPTIFEYAEMKGVLAKLAIPTVNMLFTIPAVFLVEKWGRKKLLYAGSVIMLVSLCAAGLAFQFIGKEPAMIPQILKVALLISCMIYIFGFAFSWGPVAWLICSEIFPLRGREAGMTITTVVNWTFAGLVMRYALSFMKTFGDASIFYVFAAFCLFSIVFVARFVPETKGITLEELEAKLQSKY